MPSNAKVFLHYGPYEAAGTVEFRQSRLQGMKSMFMTGFLTVDIVIDEDTVLPSNLKTNSKSSKNQQIFLYLSFYLKKKGKFETENRKFKIFSSICRKKCKKSAKTHCNTISKETDAS